MKRFVLNTHTFARQVRHWINDRPLRDLAGGLGISASTLSRISNGHKPDVDYFLSLCQAMNVDPMIFGFWHETDDEVES